MKKAILFFIAFVIFSNLTKAQLLNYTHSHSGCVPTILTDTTSTTNYVTPSTLIQANTTYSARDGANIVVDDEGNLHILGGWDSSGSLGDNHYKSVNGGITWVQQPTVGFDARHTYGTEKMNNFIYVFGSDYQAFATNQNAGVWRASSSNLTGWTEIATTTPFGYDWVYGATQHNGYLYVMGGHPAGSSANPTKLNRIFRSQDGIFWTQLCTDCLPEGGGMLTGHVESFKGHLYAISPSNYADAAIDRIISPKVWRSSDGGLNWTHVSNIPDTPTHYGNVFVLGSRMYFKSGYSPSEGNTNRLYWTEDGIVWNTITNHNFDVSHATTIDSVGSTIMQFAGNLFAVVKKLEVTTITNTTTTTIPCESKFNGTVSVSLISNPIENGTIYSSGTHVIDITATNTDGTILSDGTEIPVIVEHIDDADNIIGTVASANFIVGQDPSVNVTENNSWLGTNNLGGNTQSITLTGVGLQSSINLNINKKDWADATNNNYDSGSYDKTNGVYTSNAKRLKITIGESSVILENLTDIVTANMGQSYSIGYWSFADCSPHITPVSASNPYGNYTTFPTFQWRNGNIIDYYNWNQTRSIISGTHVQTGLFSNNMITRNEMPQSGGITLEIRHLGRWNNFTWEPIPFTPVMGNKTPSFNSIHFDYSVYTNSNDWNISNFVSTITNLANNQIQNLTHILAGTGDFRDGVSSSNINVLNQKGQRVKVESELTNNLGTAKVVFFYEVVEVY